MTKVSWPECDECGSDEARKCVRCGRWTCNECVTYTRDYELYHYESDIFTGKVVGCIHKKFEPIVSTGWQAER